MSGDSNTSLGTPLRSIGSQDLLNSFPYTKAAFIRKRGKRERIFDRLGFLGAALSKRIKWRQYFVILSKGCLYIYRSEGDRVPQRAISLAAYNRSSPQFHCVLCAYWHTEHSGTKEWMYSIKNEMISANGSSTQLTKPNNDGDYVTLEEPIIAAPVVPVTGSGYTLEKNNPNDDDVSEPDDDYNVIDESLTDANKRQLPPIPDMDKKKTKGFGFGFGKKKGESIEQRPPVSEKKQRDYVNERPKIPIKPNQKLSRSMFYFEGGRDEAIKELQDKQTEGTFLVRKSRTGPAEVLSVLTKEGVKEFKIQKEGDKIMLNNNMKFLSLEEMLQKYQSHSLPNRTLTLSRPFMSDF